MFFVYRFTQKFSITLWKIFKVYFTKRIMNKINIFFEMYNSMLHIQDHTKYFEYIMGYALKQLEMYFQLCYLVFNIFQQSWKIFMHLICLFVSPFVCAHSNFRKYSSNIFKFIHAVHIWHRIDSFEKICMGLSVHLDTHKSFPIHFGISGKGVARVAREISEKIGIFSTKNRKK